MPPTTFANLWSETFDPRDLASPHAPFMPLLRMLEDDLTYWQDRATPEEQHWLRSKIIELVNLYLPALAVIEST